MKNKLPSTFSLFALACVLFLAAPSHAAMIYDVEVTYEGGYSYEFAFIVSDSVTLFDDSTDDKFFNNGNQYQKLTGSNFESIDYTSGAVGPLSFSAIVSFLGSGCGADFCQINEVSHLGVTGEGFNIEYDSSEFGELGVPVSTGTFSSEFEELKVSTRSTAAVPEPATLSLIALGVTGLVLLRRRVQPQLEHVIPHGTNAADA